MREFFIDFAGVKTYSGFYQAIIKGLKAPEWCGENADAIWDILTGFVGAPAIVYIKGISDIPKELHVTRDLILKIMNRTTEYYQDLNKEFRVVFEDEV